MMNMMTICIINDASDSQCSSIVVPVMILLMMKLLVCTLTGATSSEDSGLGVCCCRLRNPQLP